MDAWVETLDDGIRIDIRNRKVLSSKLISLIGVGDNDNESSTTIGLDCEDSEWLVTISMEKVSNKSSAEEDLADIDARSDSLSSVEYELEIIKWVKKWAGINDDWRVLLGEQGIMGFSDTSNPKEN